MLISFLYFFLTFQPFYFLYVKTLCFSWQIQGKIASKRPQNMKVKIFLWWIQLLDIVNKWHFLTDLNEKITWSIVTRQPLRFFNMFPTQNKRLLRHFLWRNEGFSTVFLIIITLYKSFPIEFLAHKHQILRKSWLVFLNFRSHF